MDDEDQVWGTVPKWKTGLLMILLTKQNTAKGSKLMVAVNPKSPQDCGRSTLTPAFPDNAPVLSLQITPGNEVLSTPEDSLTKQGNSKHVVGEGVEACEAAIGEGIKLTMTSELKTQLSHQEAQSHISTHEASEWSNNQNYPLEGESGLENEIACEVLSCDVHGATNPFGVSRWCWERQDGCSSVSRRELSLVIR